MIPRLFDKVWNINIFWHPLGPVRVIADTRIIDEFAIKTLRFIGTMSSPQFLRMNKLLTTQEALVIIPRRILVSPGTPKVFKEGWGRQLGVPRCNQKKAAIVGTPPQGYIH
jgi:hypothetical protein